MAAAVSGENIARNPDGPSPEMTVPWMVLPFSRLVISTTVLTGKEFVAIVYPFSKN
jgi:hypothetical protein